MKLCFDLSFVTSSKKIVCEHLLFFSMSTLFVWFMDFISTILQFMIKLLKTNYTNSKSELHSVNLLDDVSVCFNSDGLYP